MKNLLSFSKNKNKGENVGLEKTPESRKGPPIFSGKAINVRFPDLIIINEKGHREKKVLWFVTFPDWIHEVYLTDKIYKVLGKDLQIGMPITLNGEIFPIIDIKEQYFHGIIFNDEHPIGYPGDIENLKKYSFKRIVKKNVDYWMIEEIKNNSYSLSKKELNFFTKEDLLKYTLELQDEYKKTTENLKILQEEPKV
jgi:hypothetical protein